MTQNPTFDIIAFDADDTLWHTEILYLEARDKLVDILDDYVDADTLARRLDETEIGNLPIYGYGVKSFLLSMVETVIALTDGRVRGADIARILEVGREMLTAEVRVLTDVEATLVALKPAYELMVITKGDASEQIPKLKRSGLDGYFRYVEVVGTKTRATYERILAQLGIPPERFLMVGNSLKSDVMPVLELDAFGVYVPSEVLWSHEHVEHPPADHPHYYELERIRDLPALIDRLAEEHAPQ